MGTVQRGLLWAMMLSIAILWPHSEASAQGCCSAGTPSMGALEQGGTPAGRLTVGFLYEYDRLRQAFEGTRKVDDPLKRNVRVATASLQLSYGLTDRVSVSLMAQYADKERRLALQDGDQWRVFSSTGKGLGDVILLGKLSLIPLDLARQRELMVGLGLKLPTGDYRQRVDGVTLSMDLQPGTGSLDGLVWTYLHQGFPTIHTHVFGSAVYRRSGENGDDYRLGDELVYQIGGSYSPSGYTDLTAMLRGRVAGQDELGDRNLPSTGGHWVYFGPGFNLNLRGVSLQTSAQWPLYRNVQGLQMALSWGFLFGIYYHIDLSRGMIPADRF